MTNKRVNKRLPQVLMQASVPAKASPSSLAGGEILSEAEMLKRQAIEKMTRLGLIKADGKNSEQSLAQAPINPAGVVAQSVRITSAATAPAPAQSDAIEAQQELDAASQQAQEDQPETHQDLELDENAPVTMGHLQLLLQTVREGEQQKMQAEIELAKQQAQEESQQAIAQEQAKLAQAQQALTDQQVELQRFKDVFKLSGSSIPHNQRSDQSQTTKAAGWTPDKGTPSYLKTFSLSNEPQGAIKHAFDLLSSEAACPTKVWLNPHNGDQYTQRDYTVLQNFYRSNKQEFRDSFECLMKNNGFLRGDLVKDATAGYTAPTSTPDNYLTVLSMMMRETHTPHYIWWQFPVTINRPGFGPESSLLIPRYSNLDEVVSEADFVGAQIDGTYFEVNNQNQALVMTTVPAQIREYMLGRGTTVGNRAVAIPEFFSTYSLTSLEQALNVRIGKNYRSFEDYICRQPFMSTNQVRYNNNDRVVDTPGAVTGDGMMSHHFLNYLYAHMVGDLQIPPLDNGTLNLVTHPTAIAQIKDGLDEKMESPTSDHIMDLTNMLQSDGNAQMIDKVQGYVGTVNNFNLFVTNAHSVGSPGSVGVQNETLGGTPAIGIQTTYSSWAFGRGVAGRGIGMPMEVRSEGAGNFGRSLRYIWVSHERTVPIDCCPLVSNPATASQQLRCLEIRTVRSRVGTSPVQLTRNV